MSSNHTFCCRPTGVFGFRATLQYICFRSSGSIGGGGVNFSQSRPFHIHGHCMEYFIDPFEKRVVYNVNFQFTRENEYF
jgi:hypothetical protein